MYSYIIHLAYFDSSGVHMELILCQFLSIYFGFTRTHGPRPWARLAVVNSEISLANPTKPPIVRPFHASISQYIYVRMDAPHELQAVISVDCETCKQPVISSSDSLIGVTLGASHKGGLVRDVSLLLPLSR